MCRRDQQYARSIRFVPDVLKLREMVVRAVVSIPVNLQFVPEQLQTWGRNPAAAQECANVQAFADNPWKSAEVCVFVVRQNGCFLKYVPDGLKTYGMGLTDILDSKVPASDIPDSRFKHVMEDMATRER